MSAAKNIGIYNELISEFPLAPIKSANQHKKALDFLSNLMDRDLPKSKSEVGQFKDYFQVLTVLIKEYEKSLEKIDSNLTPADVLRFLMEQNDLTQHDFEDEIGKQSAVSKVLNGIQELKASQIEALAKRFGIYPSSFFSK